MTDLARLVGGTVQGEGLARIRGFNGLREAEAGEISFLANQKYLALLQSTRATAVIVGAGTWTAPKGVSLLITEHPDLAFAKVMAHFAPAPVAPAAAVHPSAVVADSARVDPGACLMARCVIGADSEIGAGTVVHPGVVVGARVRVGSGCVLHPHVTLYDEVTLGDRVVVHAGAVIGSDGFGFATVDGVHRKLPQQGTVVIADEVEIGANTTIARARFGRTEIGRGTKIDNLVQIGHNVVIGEHCMIISQVGVAGSARLGRGVVVAGQVGVGGHLTIGDHAVIGARSGVTKSIPPRAVVSGMPARPHNQTRRILAASVKLPELNRALSQLEARVRDLTARIAALEN